MGRKIVKWTGIALGTVIGIAIIAGITLTILANRKLNAVYAVPSADLTVLTDAATIAEGGRLVAIRACGDCHGDDFAGQELIDDALLGTLYSTNLTRGRNSTTEGYTAADWDRAIRHGIDRDGKPLLAMPSGDYYRISDRDLERMIAYLESLPPVDEAGAAPQSRPGPMLVTLLGAGVFPLAAAEIDHSVAPPADVVADVSAEYGGYLATTCTGCHQTNLAGGPIPGAPASSTPPANLTPAGNLADWTAADFVNTLRSGVTPEGKVLDPEVMPWPITERMTDDELTAIFLYLSSLPPVASDS